MPEIKWFPVPLKEAAGFYHRLQMRRAEFTQIRCRVADARTPEAARVACDELLALMREPWTLFEARMHCAFLMHTGEIARWSLADMAEHWGWGRRSKSRAKLVLDYVRDGDNFWRILKTLGTDPSSDTLDMNGIGTLDERHMNGIGTLDERHAHINQSVTQAQMNGIGTLDERHMNGIGTPRVCARGDLSSLEVGSEIDPLIEDLSRREIRESEDRRESRENQRPAEAGPNPAARAPSPGGSKRKRTAMKKLPHDFEAQAVELVAVKAEESDSEILRFLELIERWSAEGSPERWIVKVPEVVGWFRKEILENRIGEGVDPIRAIQEWDEYLEDLAEGRKGGRFPTATGWRAALRYQFEKVLPFKRTYERNGDEDLERSSARFGHEKEAPLVQRSASPSAQGSNGRSQAPPATDDPYDVAKRYLTRQVQRWNAHLDPAQVIRELEERFPRDQLLGGIRKWRDDDSKRLLEDDDLTDVKAGIAYRAKNIQGATSHAVEATATP